jgi:hypothetical protein
VGNLPKAQNQYKLSDIHETKTTDYICAMKKLLVSLLLFFALVHIGLGQTPVTNPFELEYRIKEAMAQLGVPDSLNTAAALVNPYDVVPHKTPTKVQNLKTQKAKPGFGQIVLRPQASSKRSFVFGALAFILAILALTFGLRRAVAMKTWSAFFSNNFLNQAQRDYSGMIGAAPFYLLYIHFFLNAGLFIFLFFRTLTGDQFNTFTFFLACIGSIALIFLLKHACVHAAGWLFDCSDEASKYNFLILVFSCVLGLFLLPANLFLVLREGVASYLPFWIAATIAVFYVFRWMRSIGLFGSFIIKNFFHFLLYLCIVEMLPFALLVKVLMGGVA